MTISAELRRELLQSARRGEPLLAAFDFDGVLARIRRHPGQARMSKRTKALVRLLGKTKRTTVVIVSGRALPFLRGALAGCGAALAGDHGLELEGMGARWRHPAFAELGRHARALAHAARHWTVGLRGVEVELKAATVSVHFRRSPAVRRNPEGLRLALEALVPPGWRVAPGLMVWELRPKLDWGKGHIIEHAASRLGARALFLGDDFTDEEGFRRLGSSAWTVRVGPGPTAARFRLSGIGEVDALLAEIAAARRLKEPTT
jgi:trehalose 6-phosphate phosphatase